jgi:hypothetical protein
LESTDLSYDRQHIIIVVIVIVVVVTVVVMRQGWGKCTLPLNQLEERIKYGD